MVATSTYRTPKATTCLLIQANRPFSRPVENPIMFSLPRFVRFHISRRLGMGFRWARASLSGSKRYHSSSGPLTKCQLPLDAFSRFKDRWNPLRTQAFISTVRSACLSLSSKVPACRIVPSHSAENLSFSTIQTIASRLITSCGKCLA